MKDVAGAALGEIHAWPLTLQAGTPRPPNFQPVATINSPDGAGALGAQFHQSTLDAIPRIGIIDLLRNGGCTRPEVCRLRLRSK